MKFAGADILELRLKIEEGPEGHQVAELRVKYAAEPDRWMGYSHAWSKRMEELSVTDLPEADVVGFLEKRATRPVTVALHRAGILPEAARESKVDLDPAHP